MILESHTTAVAHGWWDTVTEETFSTKIALVHSEVSEALEYFREGTMPLNEVQYEHPGAGGGWSNSPTRDFGNGPVAGKPVGVAVELADALIRLFDLCGYYKMPLEEALRIKMEYNRTRPYRHGGKKI